MFLSLTMICIGLALLTTTSGWPSLSENVIGPVHAQKESADGFVDAAGYLEL